VTIRVSIDYDGIQVDVHLTETVTGRDQRATIPRYLPTGSEMYVRFINALDVMMYTWDNARGEQRGEPITS